MSFHLLKEQRILHNWPVYLAHSIHVITDVYVTREGLYVYRTKWPNNNRMDVALTRFTVQDDPGMLRHYSSSLLDPASDCPSFCFLKMCFRDNSNCLWDYSNQDLVKPAFRDGTTNVRAHFLKTWPPRKKNYVQNQQETTLREWRPISQKAGWIVLWSLSGLLDVFCLKGWLQVI